MNKKLTRIGIIEYCKKCNNVKNDSGKTVCGITNRFGEFDYSCDKFIEKKEEDLKKKEFVFFGNWKSALWGTLILIIHSSFQLLSKNRIDIFMIIGLILVLIWWGYLLIKEFRRVMKTST